MGEKKYGCCGLCCSDCPAFIAFKTNDNTLREKIAQEWSKRYSSNFSPEMINCRGCTSKNGPLIAYCKVCAIRKCSSKRGLSKCSSCTVFSACEERTRFEKESGLKIN